MKLLAMLCLCFMCVSCSDYPTRQLREYKIISYEPAQEEGRGIAYKLTYEFWIFEDVLTGERFVYREKRGSVGETIKMRR